MLQVSKTPCHFPKIHVYNSWFNYITKLRCRLSKADLQRLNLFCKNINISDKIIDVSEKNKKSLIITVEKNETRGYISNISTSTLERRTNKIGGIK